MKKTLLRILYRIAVFAVLVVTLDLLAGTALRYLYFNQHFGLHHRTTYAMVKTRADLIIFGSSSANHHFVPQVFDSILSLSVYNAGRDGMDILYDLAVLRSVLKRYTPKVIILNLTVSELSAVDPYDKLSALHPYYRSHPEIRYIVELRSPFEKMKLLSSIYPFNSTVLSILKGNVENMRKLKEENGYMPLYQTFIPGERKLITFKEEPVLDTNRVKALREFILLCKGRGVHLFIVNSPWYYTRIATTATLKKTREVASEYGVSYYNYTYDPFFRGTAKYFMDEGHLNDTGARFFSTLIAEKIKHEISSNPIPSFRN